MKHLTLVLNIDILYDTKMSGMVMGYGHIMRKENTLMQPVYSPTMNYY